MGASNGTPRPRFSVSQAGYSSAGFQAILDEAISVGGEQIVLDTYEGIVDRLENDPGQFGEPLYHLPKLKLAIRCAAVAPLYVEYGLHDEKPVVLVRRILALAANP